MCIFDFVAERVKNRLVKSNRQKTHADAAWVFEKDATQV
jgi:hypothetical protein